MNLLNEISNLTYRKIRRLVEARVARNVVNIGNVKQFIDSLIDHGHFESNSRPAKWLKTNLRNWIIGDDDARFVEKMDKEKIDNADYALDVHIPQDQKWFQKAVERGDELHVFNPDNPTFRKFREDITQALDFMRSMDENDEDMSKISVSDMIMKSERWHKMLAKKKSTDDFEEAGTKVLKKYPNKFRWVEILNPECLNREGQLMQNCVASYARSVESRVVSIISLRDEKNEPHVTMELRRDHLNQIKGKQNRTPEKKYHEYVIDFISDPPKGVKISSISDHDNVYGFVKYGDGVDTLENLLRNGVRSFEGIIPWPEGLTMPDRMEFKGSLRMSRNGRVSDGTIIGIAIVGVGYSIGDHVTIAATSSEKKITISGVYSIGKNFRVANGTVYFPIGLEEIGSGLRVDNGSVRFRDQCRVRSWDGPIYVSRDVYADGGRFRSFNVRKMKISKNLFMTGSEIEELPEQMEVRRSLILNESTRLVGMPKILKVGYNLSLMGTNIVSFPEKLSVGGHLVATGMRNDIEMSEELRVKGDVDLTGTNISSLPNKWKVGGRIIGGTYRGTPLNGSFNV